MEVIVSIKSKKRLCEILTEKLMEMIFNFEL